MDRKALIIIGIIALLCIGIGAYFLVTNTSPQYKNVTMNGITLEIPDSNVNVTQQTEHYSIYNDSDSGVAIFVFDSTGVGLNDLSEAVSFAAIRDSFQVGAQKQQEDNVEFNHSESLNVYTYLTNYTHKNVFIVTKNKEDLKHIISSIQVNEITIDVNETDQNETNTTTTKTKTTSKKSTVREEDKVTEDGWDPKKHEVSREKIENGYERVDYDDGYHRIVDSKGNVLSYGY